MTRDPRNPVPDVYEFTAPNLQYLMDSPVELGPLTIETFTVGPTDVSSCRAPHGDG